MSDPYHKFSFYFSKLILDECNSVMCVNFVETIFESFVNDFILIDNFWTFESLVELITKVNYEPPLKVIVVLCVRKQNGFLTHTICH